jgi:hypothetical protein
MRQDKIIRRYIIAFMIVLVFGLFLVGTAVADDGPLTVWGQVYDMDGKDPGTGFDGEDASVIIMHNGAKTEWKDPDGIERDEENETYVYAVTIDAGAWEKGDIFWIVVDASEWKESKTTCRDHDDTGVNRWTVDVSGGNQRVDVNTGDSNFKPILAIIFIIIIVVVSLLIGLMRPMKMPFSGRPKQPADLVEGMLISGEAVIPEPLPEEGAAPTAAEERTCSTCNGKLEFIQEYNAWYCDNCKKYPDEDEDLPPPPSEEEQPPKDEELPPPADEDLPPPDDEEPPAPKEGE